MPAGQQLNNREAGPSNDWHTELQRMTPVPEWVELQRKTPVGGHFYVSDALNSREGPQAREPAKCLNGQSYREDLLKRPSDCQLQEA